MTTPCLTYGTFATRSDATRAAMALEVSGHEDGITYVLCLHVTDFAEWIVCDHTPAEVFA